MHAARSTSTASTAPSLAFRRVMLLYHIIKYTSILESWSSSRNSLCIRRRHPRAASSLKLATRALCSETTRLRRRPSRTRIQSRQWRSSSLRESRGKCSLWLPLSTQTISGSIISIISTPSKNCLGRISATNLLFTRSMCAARAPLRRRCRAADPAAASSTCLSRTLRSPSPACQSTQLRILHSCSSFLTSVAIRWRSLYLLRRLLASFTRSKSFLSLEVRKRSLSIPSPIRRRIEISKA